MVREGLFHREKASSEYNHATLNLIALSRNESSQLRGGSRARSVDWMPLSSRIGHSLSCRQGFRWVWTMLSMSQQFREDKS
jgi:hypothetical protein